MFSTALIKANTDAQVTVLVELTYDPSTGPERRLVYLVTIDKIIGGAVVHHNGETKRAVNLNIADMDDEDELEEAALIAAIYFPSGD